MERWQVCGRLAANCRKCLEDNCFFIQFETNEFTCVDKLNGWSDIQRIVAPTFGELCDRLSTERPSVANIIQETGVMSFEWFLLTLDIIIFLIMIVGFYILFMRDRRIFLAISEIPSQISTLYNDHSRNNNYYVQLRRHGEIQSAESYNTSNPFIHSTNQLALGPPPHTQQETIELETIDESFSEGNSPESSPEVMPRENYVTKFNRIIRKPSFFQS